MKARTAASRASAVEATRTRRCLLLAALAVSMAVMMLIVNGMNVSSLQLRVRDQTSSSGSPTGGEKAGKVKTVIGNGGKCKTGFELGDGEFCSENTQPDEAGGQMTADDCQHGTAFKKAEGAGEATCANEMKVNTLQLKDLPALWSGRLGAKCDLTCKRVKGQPPLGENCKKCSCDGAWSGQDCSVCDRKCSGAGTTAFSLSSSSSSLFCPQLLTLFALNQLCLPSTGKACRSTDGRLRRHSRHPCRRGGAAPDGAQRGESDGRL